MDATPPYIPFRDPWAVSRHDKPLLHLMAERLIPEYRPPLHFVTAAQTIPSTAPPPQAVEKPVRTKPSRGRERAGPPAPSFEEEWAAQQKAKAERMAQYRSEARAVLQGTTNTPPSMDAVLRRCGGKAAQIACSALERFTAAQEAERDPARRALGASRPTTQHSNIDGRPPLPHSLASGAGQQHLTPPQHPSGSWTSRPVSAESGQSGGTPLPLPLPTIDDVDGQLPPPCSAADYLQQSTAEAMDAALESMRRGESIDTFLRGPSALAGADPRLTASTSLEPVPEVPYRWGRGSSLPGSPRDERPLGHTSRPGSRQLSRSPSMVRDGRSVSGPSPSRTPARSRSPSVRSPSPELFDAAVMSSHATSNDDGDLLHDDDTDDEHDTGSAQSQPFAGYNPAALGLDAGRPSLPRVDTLTTPPQRPTHPGDMGIPPLQHSTPPRASSVHRGSYGTSPMGPGAMGTPPRSPKCDTGCGPDGEEHLTRIDQVSRVVHDMVGWQRIGQQQQQAMHQQTRNGCETYRGFDLPTLLGHGAPPPTEGDRVLRARREWESEPSTKESLARDLRMLSEQIALLKQGPQPQAAQQAARRHAHFDPTVGHTRTHSGPQSGPQSARYSRDVRSPNDGRDSARGPSSRGGESPVAHAHRPSAMNAQQLSQLRQSQETPLGSSSRRDAHRHSSAVGTRDDHRHTPRRSPLPSGRHRDSDRFSSSMRDVGRESFRDRDPKDGHRDQRDPRDQRERTPRPIVVHVVKQYDTTPVAYKKPPRVLPPTPRPVPSSARSRGFSPASSYTAFTPTPHRRRSERSVDRGHDRSGAHSSFISTQYSGFTDSRRRSSARRSSMGSVAESIATDYSVDW